MRITKIEVDRFGVWRQLALPVSPRGLTVFYGPNEAGKTTLWRFICSILYGFEPFEIDLEGGVPQPVRWEGALQVEGGTDRYSVHRISDRGTRGLVSVGVGPIGRSRPNHCSPNCYHAPMKRCSRTYSPSD